MRWLALQLPNRRLASPVRQFAVGTLALLFVVVSGRVAYGWSERAGMSQLAAAATERLDLYALALESELARYDYLTGLIAVDGDVSALFNGPADSGAKLRANRTLARNNARAGSTLIFATGANDEVIASSRSGALAAVGAPATAGDSNAVVTMNALKSGAAKFFVANEASGTDYYFTQDVLRRGEQVGRVVVKVSLAALEATWVDMGLRTRSERLAVVDEHDMIVMSSVPAWKRRTLRPIGLATAGAPDRPAEPAGTALRVMAMREAAPGAMLVGIDPGAPGEGSALLSQERLIAGLGARIVSFSDPSDVWRKARYAALGGMAGAAFLATLSFYLLDRQRTLRQLLHARNALQHEHGQLERQIHERTSQLRESNEELQRQINQRVLAEDELLQAGKMAVLGQLSAAISHEVSQPLTALRSLSHNTIRLMETGQAQAAVDNLRAIDAMAVRMSGIISQMKTFARKSSIYAEPVDLSAAVQNVLLMLNHRLLAEGVTVAVEIPPGMAVRADTNRLQQVLLNLATNAADAMTDGAQRLLRIDATAHADRIRIAVQDSGRGMDDSLFGRLFEPFFTTKPAGKGLGLGLVISAKIVKELGGTLSARRTDNGMSFIFDLQNAGVPHV